MTIYPQFFRLRQKFEGPVVEDVAGEVEKQLASLSLFHDGRVEARFHDTTHACTTGVEGGFFPAHFEAVPPAAHPVARGVGDEVAELDHFSIRRGGELETVFGGCLEIGWTWFGTWRLSFGDWWLDLGGLGDPGGTVRGGPGGSHSIKYYEILA